MKSMNIKRVAAVAAGAAMIGSVMATGLAAVNTHPTSEDVTTFIGSVKANLGNTQVVCGTNGAAISDWLACGKLAAVLSSLNYQPTTGGTEGTFTYELTGATVSSTPSNWMVEYVANASVPNMATGYEAGGKNVEITYNQLADVLKQRSITPTINNSAETHIYEDKIRLYGGQPRYTESSSTAGGYGLFYKLSPSGTQSLRGLVYELKFAGDGLPVTSAYSYQSIPEVYIHGHAVGIDTANVAHNKLVLFSGTKTTVREGDTVTQDDYTVSIDAIGATTSSSGTQYAVSFTVTDGDGNTDSASVNEGSTGYFFGTSVSISVDSVTGSTAVVRIGTGTLTFNTGNVWTLGDTTSSTSEWIFENATVSSSNKLTTIRLRYGNPSNADMSYNFDGTHTNGLAQGTWINGPVDPTGDPFFKLRLKGFGSQSTEYKTTEVTLEGHGSESDFLTQAVWADWTSRDGMAQKWHPEGYAYVARNSTGAGTAGQLWATVDPDAAVVSDELVMNISASYPTRWAIVNDKVLYFVSLTAQSGSSTLYDAIFKIGGVDGVQIPVSGINASVPGTLQYTTSVNPIYCNITMPANADVSVRVGPMAGNDDIMSHLTASDRTSGGCDLYPDIVPMGVATDIAQTNHPYMDMRFSLGNMTSLATANTSGINTAGDGDAAAAADEPWGYVIVNESINTPGIAVVWDNDNTAGQSDIYTGLKVYNVSLISSTFGYLNINGTPAHGDAVLINQAKAAVYDADKHHITINGAELDGTVTNKVTATLPDRARNTVVEVSALAAADGGEMTGTVGDTISGVTITSVGGGYSQQTAIDPASLVVKDTQASASYQIVVGGHFVNLVAATFTNKDLLQAAGDQYIIVEGNKALVAGWLATDTTAAVDEMIDLLTA